MVSLIQESSNMENGYYKIDKDSARIIADKLGTGYSESNLKEGYVKIINNESLSQSIIIIGNDKAEIEKMVNSIVWKEVTVSGNLSVNTTTVEEPVYEETTTETTDNTNDAVDNTNNAADNTNSKEWSEEHAKEMEEKYSGVAPEDIPQEAIDDWNSQFE